MGVCVCVCEHIWSLDSLALWAESYLRAASGPETGHVDIGGTHTYRHLFQQSVHSPNTPLYTHTDTHFAGHFYPPLRDAAGDRVEVEPAEVPGNQKEMQVLRISTINPMILLFIAVSGY